MDLNLQGRHALITGGSKGIGLATALRLAEAGCNLTLVARDRETLETAKLAIAAQFDVAVGILALDLTDSGAAQTALATAGTVDILVNNAGAITAGGLIETDEDTWRLAWELKVFGYINLSRAAYREMTVRGRGVIINVIGAAGERPDGLYLAGSSGNAALMAFTRGLGGESVRHGIRVVGVNPGSVATDRLVGPLRRLAAKKLGSEDRWNDLFASLPMKRAAEADEIATVVAFLASDLASYVSGTIVTVDGGAGGRNRFPGLE